jgi:mono/diheme cytochrome c family protein
MTRERSSQQMKTGSSFRCEVILWGLAAVSMVCAQGKRGQESTGRQPNPVSGKETFLKYCASCHGEDGKGNGPAAMALKPPPSDLTTLSVRDRGKYPAGYIAALVKFGKSLAAHGSLDMPVWGLVLRS